MHEMHQYLYLDTSIWLDYYEKRDLNGEHALKLIMKIIRTDKIILYSDLHTRELKNVGYTIDQINAIFQILKQNNIRHVHIYTAQIVEARSLTSQRNVPTKDALHSVLARDNDAILISRDKHFEKLKDIVGTKKPEELY